MFAADAPSYRALARKVGASGAEAVYIAGIVLPGTALLADLRTELGADLPVLGGDGLESILEQPGRFGVAAEGVFFTVPGPPPERLGPAGRVFLTAFTREIRSTPLPIAPYAAQATDVVRDAIARSNGTRASVTARLMSTKVDDGILGSFSFTPSGDTTAGAVTLYQWRSGRARMLRVITPSLRFIASR
jgi:ABC-type branched-subunit amino acid transport system substrate-binding protein